MATSFSIDTRTKLIIAQVEYLKERGWHGNAEGFMAKPGTHEYIWDLDHAVLCEATGDRDNVTGFERIVNGRIEERK